MQLLLNMEQGASDDVRVTKRVRRDYLGTHNVISADRGSGTLTGGSPVHADAAALDYRESIGDCELPLPVCNYF